MSDPLRMGVEACRLTGEQGRYQLSGAMTVATATRLLPEGLKVLAASSTAVVDLSAVTLADSAGLAVLLVWLSRAREIQCALSFSGMPAQLLAIARVCGVADALPVSGV